MTRMIALVASVILAGWCRSAPAQTGNATGSYLDVENGSIYYEEWSSTETYAYDAANHRVERISAQGYDNVYFYGPNGTVLRRLCRTGHRA